MPDTDITQTTYTDMASRVTDFSVDTRQTDSIHEQDETYWDNSKFSQWFGYYKEIPEFKTAIQTFATWVVGRGWESDSRTTSILNNVDGWGEDTFLSILWNMITMKKVSGDAFAEIIRNDDGTLINLKPLDPGNIRIVANKKGRVKRYEQRSKAGKKEVFRTFQPYDILHLCNDRVADEIHGTSIIEAIEWVILARNEAMNDFRRILHRSTIRILEVDEDDKTRLDNIKRDYAEAIKRGEVLLVPKGTGTIQDLSAPQTQHIEWIRYLENFFYQSLGVPKIILGGSENSTEASAKVGMVVFDPIYQKEIKELEADLYNQLGLRVTLLGQKSIMDNIQTQEQKNPNQIGFQPNDVQAGKGREQGR